MPKVIYEVNLEVQKDISNHFHTWLNEHIKEMLTIDGFEKAQWLQEEKEETSTIYWTVQYFLKSKQDLENYFEHHAQKQRSGGLEKFGNKFKANRRVFTISENFQ